MIKKFNDFINEAESKYSTQKPLKGWVNVTNTKNEYKDEKNKWVTTYGKLKIGDYKASLPSFKTQTEIEKLDINYIGYWDGSSDNYGYCISFSSGDDKHLACFDTEKEALNWFKLLNKGTVTLDEFYEFLDDSRYTNIMSWGDWKDQKGDYPWIVSFDKY
jgi:hypothetical protein